MVGFKPSKIFSRSSLGRSDQEELGVVMVSDKSLLHKWVARDNEVESQKKKKLKPF